jgi:adenine-specific DNA methylase
VKKFCYIVLFLLATLGAAAQGDGKKEKIEALRVAFITKQLNLSGEESQKFWPVYNEYQDKLKAARREMKAHRADFGSDKEAQEFLDAELLYRQRELSLYKEYYDKFRKVLPVKKVAELRHAEEEFKKELLKQLQGKPND